MPDILHDFPIAATRETVFDSVSTPAGLDRWWTRSSSGTPGLGNEYTLFFPPDHDWRAKVTRCVRGGEFELEIVRADADWIGTRVGFHLSDGDRITQVRFHHSGWKEINRHFRVSSFCWAMYLRVLRRNLESGEVVPYESRLSA